MAYEAAIPVIRYNPGVTVQALRENTAYCELTAPRGFLQALTRTLSPGAAAATGAGGIF